MCPLTTAVNRDDSLWLGGTPDVLTRRTVAGACLALVHGSLLRLALVCFIRLLGPIAFCLTGHCHHSFGPQADQQYSSLRFMVFLCLMIETLIW